VALWFDVNTTIIFSLFSLFNILFLSCFAIFPISRLGFLSQTLRPSRPGNMLPPNPRSTSLPASSAYDPSNSNFFSLISSFFICDYDLIFPCIASQVGRLQRDSEALTLLEEKMRPVFCGNLDFDARQSDVERLFRRYGKVDRVDMKSGISFFVFVDFYFNFV